MVTSSRCGGVTSELGWTPRYGFADVLLRARDQNGDIRSDLARTLGLKGYHAQ